MRRSRQCHERTVRHSLLGLIPARRSAPRRLSRSGSDLAVRHGVTICLPCASDRTPPARRFGASLQAVLSRVPNGPRRDETRGGSSLRRSWVGSRRGNPRQTPSLLGLGGCPPESIDAWQGIHGGDFIPRRAERVEKVACRSEVTFGSLLRGPQVAEFGRYRAVWAVNQRPPAAL
jgi:hypothetical protein